jgi:hypothetical protein
MILCLCGLGEMAAQTSMVNLPSQPPENGLYQAAAGNRYFDLYQAAEVSSALVHFSQKTGIRACLVLMNSPSAEVFENLRQQARIQWCETDSCMVIFYDFDTRMLAVQTSPTYRDVEGNLVSNRFDAMAEEAWIQWIDQWMKARGQQAGLDVSLLGEFTRDYLRHLEQLWVHQEEVDRGALPRWSVIAGAVFFLGFLLFLFMQFRIMAQKKWFFPLTEIPPRLKARHGGGLISAHSFASKQK